MCNVFKYIDQGLYIHVIILYYVIYSCRIIATLCRK